MISFFFLNKSKKKINYLFKFILIEKLLNDFNNYNDYFLFNKKIKIILNNTFSLHFKYNLNNNTTFILNNKYYFKIQDNILISLNNYKKSFYNLNNNYNNKTIFIKKRINYINKYYLISFKKKLNNIKKKYIIKNKKIKKQFYKYIEKKI